MSYNSDLNNERIKWEYLARLHFGNVLEVTNGNLKGTKIKCYECNSLALVVRIDKNEGAIFNNNWADKIKWRNFQKNKIKTLRENKKGELENLSEIFSFFKEVSALSTEDVRNLKFYCSKCEKVYCENCYRTSYKYGKEFSEYTYFTCPKGHKRVVETVY